MPETLADAGTVQVDGEFATLLFERKYPHPPERVWAALTQPVELAQWYLTRARIDGRVGGTIDFWAGPSQFHVTGQILTWDPPRVFEHEWKVEPRSELPAGEDAVIRWDLRPVEGGTLLRLRHRHLRRATASGFAPGTHAFLDRLDAQLAGQPLPNWQARYQAVASAYLPARSPGKSG